MTKLYPLEVIQLDRIRLRMIEAKDAEGIFAIRNDLEMIKYSGITRMMTMDEANTFVETRIEGIKKDRWVYYIIVDPIEDQLMGTICLFNFNKEDASCDIGYELLPAYQGKGYIHEAIMGLMTYSLNVFGIKAFYADISQDNLASINVVLRAGFTFDKDLDNGYKLFSASSAKGLLST